MTDHYATLGVPPTASAQEIRAAYRRRARLLHPDVHAADLASEAALLFRELTDAYDVLSDPLTRSRYDALRARATAPRPEPQPDPQPEPQPRPAPPRPAPAPAPAPAPSTPRSAEPRPATPRPAAPPPRPKNARPALSVLCFLGALVLLLMTIHQGPAPSSSQGMPQSTLAPDASPAAYAVDVAAFQDGLLLSGGISSTGEHASWNPPGDSLAMSTLQENYIDSFGPRLLARAPTPALHTALQVYLEGERKHAEDDKACYAAYQDVKPLGQCVLGNFKELSASLDALAHAFVAAGASPGSSDLRSIPLRRTLRTRYPEYSASYCPSSYPDC